MPARKIPRHLKLLRTGRIQPCRDTETIGFPPATELPRAPVWLCREAVLEFDRLARVLRAHRLLTEGNVGLLAHYVMLGVRLEEIWSAGGVPKAALMATYRRIGGDLHLGAVRAEEPAA